jgi:two-component system phosphate regulon sensor histidine kinase PhoR
MSQKSPFVIFYATIIYALAQLFWWGYRLVILQPTRIGMVLGEGSMFVVGICPRRLEPA